MTRKCDLQTRCTNYMMAWNLCCLKRYTQCRGEIVKRSWIDSLHPQERFTSCSSWLKSKRMEFCSPVPTKKVVDENIFPAAIFWNSFLYLWYNGLTRLLQSWHAVGSLHKWTMDIQNKVVLSAISILLLPTMSWSIHTIGSKGANNMSIPDMRFALCLQRLTNWLQYAYVEKRTWTCRLSRNSSINFYVPGYNRRGVYFYVY